MDQYCCPASNPVRTITDIPAARDDSRQLLPDAVSLFTFALQSTIDPRGESRGNIPSADRPDGDVLMAQLDVPTIGEVVPLDHVRRFRIGIEGPDVQSGRASAVSRAVEQTLVSLDGGVSGRSCKVPPVDVLPAARDSSRLVLSGHQFTSYEIPMRPAASAVQGSAAAASPPAPCTGPPAVRHWRSPARALYGTGSGGHRRSANATPAQMDTVLGALCFVSPAFHHRLGRHQIPFPSGT